MEFMTIKDAALKWGVSERTAQQLCTAGRVEGAQKFGGSWAIPADAAKPADPRRASNTERAMAAVSALSDAPEAADMSSTDVYDEARASEVIPSDRDSEPNTEQSPESNPDRPVRVAMPLVNTAFTPGDAKAAAARMEDPEQRDIALAEYYYFSGQAEAASDIAERYITYDDVALRLSACWLYAYSNLALDRISRARLAMEHVRDVLSRLDEHTPANLRATAVCVYTGAHVLLHLPLPEGVPPMNRFIHILPPGLRLFALYVQAHAAYLQKAYGNSIGIVETALALEGDVYPIPSIYLHLVATMDYMSLRDPARAKEHLMAAWELARPDDLIEALGEHHGLLGGMLEATLKWDYPEDFRRIIAITYKFSAGWRKIHNPDTGNNVADNLTTTEFAAAMLAARDWSNKEIAAHMGISEHTVKSYIAAALQKLHLSQRKELKKHMLQ